MWHCVIVVVIPDILKDRSAFLFKYSLAQLEWLLQGNHEYELMTFTTCPATQNHIPEELQSVIISCTGQWTVVTMQMSVQDQNV
jgi:hypothetical protein